ncbi:hypothetical protein GSI_07616 [Ganoderma sinense ZZ0214-1]|uniref:DUF7330 domain-containing protein n=1 Tax=Ganoderma sinense ZZ0214-1 TaxID=1077348 RepID=A0A2G8S9K0_9APHY|nr:hypothetical protein GSI_07616 [Ganoderma sinense ZZ0214-1]
MILNNPDAPEMKGIVQVAPPVPEKHQAGEALPPPPPYSPPPVVNVARQMAMPGPPVPGTSAVFQPVNPQRVNYFELFSKHDAISGTYLIDPELPSPMAGLSKALRKKPDSVWGKTKSCKKSKGYKELNASFQTRHGHINLDLAVPSRDPGNVSPFPHDKLRTRMFVATRHGRIRVDVHEVKPSCSLDLHVESRHGRISILLPPTFDGPLVIHARTLGAVTFLPHLAARTRTLRATDRETVVLVASPLTSSHSSSHSSASAKQLSELAGAEADRCLVRTRHGKITIGISGLDRLEEPVQAGSIFEKVGRFLEMQGKAFGQYVEKKTQEWAAGMPADAKLYGQPPEAAQGRYPQERYATAMRQGSVGSAGPGAERHGL